MTEEKKQNRGAKIAVYVLSALAVATFFANAFKKLFPKTVSIFSMQVDPNIIITIIGCVFAVAALIVHLATRERKKYTVTDMVTVGLFSAICYVALYLKIPIPSPVGTPFLHLGNMFVILAALLFTGTVGGLAGSIGMGLHDAFNGYVTSVPKTLLLKFGIGVIVGKVASKGNDKEAQSPFGKVLASSVFFMLIGIGLMVTAFVKGSVIEIEGVEKQLVISPFLYIFSIILGLLLLAAAIYSKKLSIKLQYAALGAVCGILFNLAGEFVYGVITLLVTGSAFLPAVLGGLFSLPATIINGAFSIVGAVALYIPLEKAVKKITVGKKA